MMAGLSHQMAGGAEIDPRLDRWVRALLDELCARGVEHTPLARNLLVMALAAQAAEGPSSDPQKISDWLARFSLPDIATLYATKYNYRRLSFNRCVRFLADLHELWLDVRAGELARSPATVDPPA